MSEFADRLANLSIRAESPDGRIAGHVEGRMRVQVRFVGDAYGRYAEGELGHQLGQLAAVLWSRYRRGYDEVTATYRDGSPAPYETPEDIGFRDRRANLIVHGRSPHGWIKVTSRALVRWEVDVAGGAVRALSETDFLAELDGVVTDVLRRWQQEVIVLSDEIYGIGVPAALRQAPTGS
jgi:hypothetical protein